MGDGRGIDRFEDDKITGRLFNVNDVQQPIVVRDLEGEDLLAQLTVQLLEFYDNLSAMDFHGLFRLQPAFEALQMDRRDGTDTVTRGDQWVKKTVIIHLVGTPTDSASRLVV